MGSNPISCNHEVRYHLFKKQIPPQGSLQQQSYNRLVFLRNLPSAKMSERLRSATQVRVAQASWVRFPLFASEFEFSQQKNTFNSVSSVEERSALNRTVEGSTPSQSAFVLERTNRHSSAVERVALNHSVEGSIPSGGDFFCRGGPP
jgi:hypothetical protein